MSKRAFVTIESNTINDATKSNSVASSTNSSKPIKPKLLRQNAYGDLNEVTSINSNTKSDQTSTTPNLSNSLTQ